jgi:hypothetical protein
MEHMHRGVASKSVVRDVANGLCKRLRCYQPFASNRDSSPLQRLGPPSVRTNNIGTIIETNASTSTQSSTFPSMPLLTLSARINDAGGAGGDGSGAGGGSAGGSGTGRVGDI